jgi:2-amino-4-hydroxy-6-hydroxymethyldihydropteridine diphosphokinase
MRTANHNVIVSLGSNLGDRLHWISQATDLITKLPQTRVTARSSIYETEPVGVDAASRDKLFLNAVLQLSSSLSPAQLLAATQQIETQLLRTRSAPNQPRTVDIDIITFDDIESDAPNLTLPHPRAALRRFVLQPLAEINPGCILPGNQFTVSEILEKLPPYPSVKLARCQWSAPEY